MAKPQQPLSEWTEQFIERTRIARKLKFKDGDDMADALQVEKPAYRKYEKRTPLPHEHVARFCLITGVSVEWLFTGKGVGPKAATAPKKAA